MVRLTKDIARSGDLEQAKQMLDLTRNAARRQQVKSWYYSDLAKVASAMAEIGRSSEAKTLFNEIQAGITATPEDSLGNTTMAMVSIAREAAVAGFTEHANDLLETALKSIASLLSTLGTKSIAAALSGIAIAYLNLDNLQTTLDISYLLTFLPIDHGHLLKTIIDTLIIDDTGLSASLLISRDIKDPVFKSKALSVIAEAYEKAGDSEFALSLLDQAKSALVEMDDEYDPSDFARKQDGFASLVLSLSRMGHLRQAINVVLEQGKERDPKLINIARGLVTRGQMDLANQFFKKGLEAVEDQIHIDRFHGTNKAERQGWVGLSQALIEVGEVQLAKDILDKMSSTIFGVVPDELTLMVAAALARHERVDEAFKIVENYQTVDKDFAYAATCVAAGNMSKASDYAKKIEDHKKRLWLQSMIQASGEFGLALDVATSLPDAESQLHSVEIMLNLAISDNRTTEVSELDKRFNRWINDKKFFDLKVPLLICSARTKLFLDRTDEANLLLSELWQTLQEIDDIATRLFYHAIYLGLAKEQGDQLKGEDAARSLLEEARSAPLGPLMSIVAVLGEANLTGAKEAVLEILRDRYYKELDSLEFGSNVEAPEFTLSAPQMAISRLHRASSRPSAEREIWTYRHRVKSTNQKPAGIRTLHERIKLLKTPDQLLEFVEQLNVWVEVVGTLIDIELYSEAETLLKQLVRLWTQLPDAPSHAQMKANAIVEITRYLLRLNMTDYALSLAGAMPEPGDQAGVMALVIKTLAEKDSIEEAQALLIRMMLLARYRFDVLMMLFATIGPILPRLIGAENVVPVCKVISEAEKTPIFAPLAEDTLDFMKNLFEGLVELELIIPEETAK